LWRKKKENISAVVGVFTNKSESLNYDLCDLMIRKKRKTLVKKSTGAKTGQMQCI